MAIDSPPDDATLAAVRRKYDAEARKRLRPDGAAQFVPLPAADDARLRALAADPWADHAALNAAPPAIAPGDFVKFFVLGAGFGGLQFAVRLLEAGLAAPDDIRLADAAGGFGGTWYWNRFPGLHCDVEAYSYMPLLEETGYVPSKRYAPGDEIRRHADRIAARWRLADKALFRADVQSLRWDGAAQLWHVELEQGRGPDAPPVPIAFRAETVYLAAGVLTRPQIPRIPGLASFSGHLWHTARWDYGVSGGTPTQPVLDGLRGKRVAVVGTAATAVAVIPEVARYAAELFVVQRTPAYVKPRGQHDTDPAVFAAEVAHTPGWQLARRIAANQFITNAGAPPDAVHDRVRDGWTDMPAYSALLGSPRHGVVDPAPDNVADHVAAFHRLDLPSMQANRARVAAVVRDPATAARLQPWYPSWCKRPTFSDAYLAVFNEPHVHLVDTDGQGPARATPRGLVVGDAEIPLDAIVFATGYSTAGRGTGSPAARTGVRIVGRGGRTLDDKWAQRGARTLHGYATSGFPNLFFTGSSQATATGNNIWMLDLIAQHVVYILGQARARVAGPAHRPVVEPTPAAEERHTAEIVKRAAFFAALAGCTPGYFNGHGEGALAPDDDPDAKKKRAQSVAWSEGTLSYLQYLQRWRDEGALDGLDVQAVAV